MITYLIPVYRPGGYGPDMAVLVLTKELAQQLQAYRALWEQCQDTLDETTKQSCYSVSLFENSPTFFDMYGDDVPKVLIDHLEDNEQEELANTLVDASDVLELSDEDSLTLHKAVKACEAAPALEFSLIHICKLGLHWELAVKHANQEQTSHQLSWEQLKKAAKGC